MDETDPCLSENKLGKASHKKSKEIELRSVDMIQLTKNKRVVGIATTVFACVLAMPPLLSEVFAASLPEQVKTYVASNERIPSDEIKFDGKGKIDAINPVGVVSTKETQNSLASAIVIIDGLQMQFSSDIKVYDDFSQPVSADTLHPGTYVGFKKNPSDLISELWFLKPEAVVSNTQTVQNPSPPVSTPHNSTPLQNVGGVWKN